MKETIFLPGIMGSELRLGNELVWPPTLGEAMGGYNRVSKLLDPSAVRGDVIREVGCFDVYKPLLKMLDQRAPDERFSKFAYDWRQDLFDSADELATFIGQVDTGDQIRIVAHSMGGLIARLALESGSYDNRTWFDRVTHLITLATPHKGAPQALARILGIEGTMGLSAADTRTVTNDPRYPSAYQLLPAPDEQAAWDLRLQDSPLIDLYAQGQQALGLDAGLLQKAADVHNILAAKNRPSHVRYFAFVASGHDTITRVNKVSAGSGFGQTEGDDAGDGTVPMWSAAAGAIQKQVAAGEHAKFFRDEDVQSRIADLLGRPPRFRATRANSIRLSVNKPIFNRSEPFIEILIVPTRPVGQIAGSLVIYRADDGSQGNEVNRVPVQYNGPEVSRLTVQLALPTMSGGFWVEFEGSPPGDVTGADAFAIRATSN